MKLSNNITTKDIQCNCGCGFNKISTLLILVLQDIRTHFGKPIHINSRNHSACRCHDHNISVGGKKDSKHLPDINGVARACDFEVEDIDLDTVHKYVTEKYPTMFGIGKYSTFIHIDVGSIYPRRWHF